MLEIAKLQFRKNRLPFAGMAGTILASVPFGAAVALVNGHPARFGVDSILYFWSFLGLPLVAVLLGSSSGAANALDPLRSAEELLPVSGRKAAFASMGASLAQTLALAALFLLLAFAVSAQWRESLVLVVPQATRWLRAVEAPIVRPLFWMCVGVLPLFVASSFAAAWTIRNGVAGGFLGLAAGAVTVLSLSAGLAIQMFYAYRAPFGGTLGWVLASAVLSTVWVLLAAARWLGRSERMTWKRWAALAAAFSFGSAAAFGALSRSWLRVNSGVSFAANPNRDFSWFSRRPAHERIHPAAARTAEMSGAVMRSLDGGVLFVRPDGTRKVLASAVNRTALSIVLDGPETGLQRAVWDRFGKLWVVRPMPGADGRSTRFELWRGDPGAGLRYHSPAGSAWWDPLLRIGDEIGTVHWNAKDYDFIPFDAGGKSSGKNKISFGYDERDAVVDEWLRQGYAGTLSADGRSFSATLPDGIRREWRLPGTARLRNPGDRKRVAVRARGRSFFAIELEDASGFPSLALLDFDGGTRVVWNGIDGAWPLAEITARGGLYRVKDGTLYAMTPEGEFLPPTDLSRFHEAVAREGLVKGEPYRLLRVEKDRAVFLIDSGRLATVRVGGGEILESAALPESEILRASRREYAAKPLFLSEEPFSVAESGLFWHTGRRLYFVEWGGSVRDLGAA